ncbi:alanyl-tRNA editing protein [archaeon SCG-AAA382B04]|nr:alanyl-tRNA editing protein [archaeon SCG-AAA382B04]
MTELIYFNDCYQKEFDAEVKESKKDRVVLDRTAFYPKGGGQPSDTGQINGVRVEKARKKGKTVEHVLEENNLEEGQSVHGEIDWEKRYLHMKYHTAQHILSAIILEKYGGKTKGNQLYSDRARIDFDKDILNKKEEIEEEVNEIIQQARDVNIFTMQRERAVEELDSKRTRIDLLPDSIKELRIIEIENLDKTACAGTHVKNTEEIGNFKITQTINKGKDRNRIEFTLD